VAPFALEEILGKTGMYLVYLTIGFGFGSVLEMAGFANSRRLAAQFYFRDLTVLKVMFTAIITAMVLIFLFSGLGLLDYGRIWVNPTYLVPGIVGGLIMGVGFIVGGFCPGTSLVAVATFKVDGLFFFLGVNAGVLLFGESVSRMTGFWYSTSMGRFTLPQWLGLDTGVVVLLVVLMALFMFWGGEKLERRFGGVAPSSPRQSRLKLAAAGGLLGIALLVLVIGQPSVSERWAGIARQKGPLLEQRQVQIHPGELVDLIQNEGINLTLLDVRDEADFNLFHLIDSKRVTSEEVLDGLLALRILTAPQNTVTVLISNDETGATEAWKLLVAQNVPNLYILEGGINNWLDLFGHAGHAECLVVAEGEGQDALRHYFATARGADHPEADPDLRSMELSDYTPKVKLETRRVVGGGCG